MFGRRKNVDDSTYAADRPATVAHRSWYSPTRAVMTLIGLAQGNSIYQAIFAGLLIGGLFSGGVLAMAAYFQGNEQRSKGG